MFGPGDEGEVFEFVAPVGELWRQRIVLALVRECLVVKRLEHDVDLFLKHVAIFVLVHHHTAEGLHFSGVIAAPDPEDDAAIGEDVGGGVVLGQS